MTDSIDPQTPPGDRLFALIASIPGSGTVDWCGPARALLDEIAAPSAAVSPPPATDRAALLREAADECDKAGAVYAARAQNEHAAGAFALTETFLRKANEAEYVATPCDFAACEPGGEPCSVHERLMAHAEGDHELCKPDCDPGRVDGEEQQAETQAREEIGSALARYIVEQPVSVVQAALRILGWPPLRFELVDDPATPPAVVAEPGRGN